MNTIIQQSQFSLSTLKPNQILFLEWIYAEELKRAVALGLMCTSVIPNTSFSRQYLKTIAKLHGMSWAPAWIVKNVNRIQSRGFYNIPEYTEWVIAHESKNLDSFSLQPTTPNNNETTI